MKNEWLNIQQNYNEQQRVLEEELTEKRLNKQQFEEKLAELKANVKAKEEYEARFKQQQEQRASSSREIEKLKFVLQETDKLTAEDRRRGQEIIKKFEEQQSAIRDQLNQNNISKEQFEEQNSVIETLRRKELETKDREIAEQREQLESRPAAETSDDEGTWFDYVAERVLRFGRGAKKRVDNFIQWVKAPANPSKT
ncbi:hypothetical protein EB796_020381 [Bugula neritina]|uniref:Uncharacterized protein n=1 Tax=Bugula neritina TaxID=10212 RepID=A0A7J7J5Z3_BUGNE|nr:hypothetical protein EB796_020381 [Bugula neritina]